MSKYKKMYQQDSLEIAHVIDQYFQGIFNGDTETLQSVFHPEALLLGDVKGVPYAKHVDEYIEGVKNRKSPKALGETFRMKILSIELLNSIAYAKLHTPMFDFNYYDYLSFHKIEGKWMVVNKLFTHLNHS